jgi:anti-anti-sigma factor
VFKVITSQLDNNQLTININGSLTVDVFQEFEASYNKKPVEKIIIDFAGCHHIDSGGLGMLLQLRERFQGKGENIVLKNLSNEILKVFEVVKFEKLFSLH